MESDVYRVINGPSTGSYKEKGSKFMAFAFPVETEEEIKTHVETLKKEYFDARHHCYAWVLGPEKTQYRINDDGEPSGTAGRPIYGQILSHDVTNILVVVVRYFGGTKLGVSGLIRAYKAAALDALSHAGIMEETVKDLIQIKFKYQKMNDIMRILKEFDVNFKESNFDMDCRILFSIRKSETPGITSRLKLLNENDYVLSILI